MEILTGKDSNTFGTGPESRPIKLNGNVVSTRPGINLQEGPGVRIITRDSPALAHVDVELRSNFSRGSTFPVNPYHGDSHIIPQTVNSEEQSWMFVYNADTSDEMKWEFIGGAPGHSRVAAEVTRGFSASDGAGGSYAATDCTVTMPASITWDVYCTFGCRSYTTGGTGGSQAYFSLSHDGAAANNDWAAQSQQTNATYGDPIMTCTSAVQFSSVAAGDAIVFEIKAIGASGTTSKYTRRYLSVWPIRAKNA